MDYFQNKCYILKKFNEKHYFLPRKPLFWGVFKRGFIMSAEKMPQLIAAGESHMGCVRTHNEDNFFCMSLYPGYCFAGVADGVGGHSGGEQASYLCCHRLMLDWKELFKHHTEPDESVIASFLMNSVKQANSDITGINRVNKKKHNPMCTTLAAAVFTPSMVIVVHVGDSRLYCQRKDVCRLLTIDHTVQNELTEQGVTDAAQLPGAHVISKAIGTDRYLKPEIHTYFRTPEDRFLFCTDGLSNTMLDSEISSILSVSSDPRQANDRFIREALRRRANDNVTVVSVFPVNE